MTVDPPQLATIEVHPPEATLNVGAQKEFSVTGTDQLGNPFSNFDTVTWETSGGGTLDPSGNTCTYRATAYGEYWLTCAVASGRSTFQGSAVISVVPPQLAVIALTPPYATIQEGCQQTFEVTGMDQYGDPFNALDSVLWSNSEGGEIVSSGSTCTYSAVVPGKDTLACMVTAGGSVFQATASIGVGDARLTAIEVLPADVTLGFGDQQQFTAISRDQFDHLITPVKPLWTVTGGGITPEGMYTAGRVPGQYRVSAFVEGTSIVGESRVVIPGVSCSDPSVTITDQSVTLNPEYDFDGPIVESVRVPAVHWERAFVCNIGATGEDGSYSFSITCPSPFATDSKLFQLPEWTPLPWVNIDSITFSLTLDIEQGTLAESFVLAPVLELDDSGGMPAIP